MNAPLTADPSAYDPDDPDLQAAATHEAGHAVAAVHIGLRCMCLRLELPSGGHWRGRMVMPPGTLEALPVRECATIVCAGPLAESLCYWQEPGIRWFVKCISDSDFAALPPDPFDNLEVIDGLQDALALLSEPDTMAAIQEMAQTLLRQRVIRSDEWIAWAAEGAQSGAVY